MLFRLCVHLIAIYILTLENFGLFIVRVFIRIIPMVISLVINIYEYHLPNSNTNHYT